MPAESNFFILDGQEMAFADVSHKKTFTLAMNEAVTLWVNGVALAPGDHKMRMCFDGPGLGTLRSDFTDTVTDE